MDLAFTLTDRVFADDERSQNEIHGETIYKYTLLRIPTQARFNDKALDVRPAL